MYFETIAHNVRTFAEHHPNPDDPMHMLAVDATIALINRAEHESGAYCGQLDTVTAALRTSMWDAAPLLLCMALARIADNFADRLDSANLLTYAP